MKIDERELISLADGVIVLDRDLRIVSFSEGAERITGYERKDVVAKRCAELFHSGTCETGCPSRRTLETGQVVSNQQYTIYTKDDDEIPVVVSTAPLVDSEGEVTGVVATLRNIAEVTDLTVKLTELGQEVLREKDKLSAILNSIAEGVFTVDSEYRVTSFNAGAARITGYTADEVMGKPCHSVFRSSLCGSECPLKQTVRTGEMVRDREMEMFTKGNRAIPVGVTTALLRDEKNEVVGAVETFRDLSRLKQLTEELQGRYSFGNIIGKSPAMGRIYEVISEVAPTTTTVLIVGATGTGKELMARAIHYHSPRRDRSFVAVNCAALPENLLESELFGHVKGAFTGAISARKGRFELADGGTIFLDEVGEMSPVLQAKLLRVLESNEFERVGDAKTTQVDVRLVAATNQDLEARVRERSFREDLYYRLNVLTLKLPPLRERREDIPVLVAHFIDQFNKRSGKHITEVSPEALEILVDHPWPGNVRQLENAIEHAFVHCRSGQIQPEHLPEELAVRPSPEAERAPGAHTIEAAEKATVLSALEANAWSPTHAARALGISRTSLWRKMKKHGIARPQKNT